jgi:predicted DNA-binding protein
MVRAADGTQRRGRPRNSARDVTTPLAIRLTGADRESLQALAEENGMPLATYIVEVLRSHVREESRL